MLLELDMTENEAAKQIVDAAFQVHTALGPGLLESVYEVVLAYELEQRGFQVVRQQAIPVVYRGTRVEMGFRADLIVEDKVIIEIKCVEVAHLESLVYEPVLQVFGEPAVLFQCQDLRARFEQEPGERS